MFNEINRNEQIFECKIDSSFYLIKLILIDKQINIMIAVISQNNSNNTSEYINNYSLSHFQEINNYFKIFNSIKDIYKDLLKIINNKNFTIINNEDKTLYLIIKIQINDKIRKINLALSKNQSNNINYKINNNNKIYDLNYELNDLGNRLSNLEESQRLYTYPNQYNMKNNLISYSDAKYNPLETLISKLNILEEERNDKNQKIKFLEEKLYFYKNNGKRNLNLKKIPNYKNYINKNNIPRNNINANSNNYLITSLNSQTYKNNYTIYSDNFEINRNRRNNLKNFRPYNSMEKNINNEKIKNHNYTHSSKYNLSSDYKNNGKRYLNMSSIKYNKYLNNIPIVKRENILNLHSRIIFTNKEAQLLINRIVHGNKKKIVTLKLLYRASIDGDCEEILKSKCRNALKKLTLFYTQEGARFGVYIEKYLKNSFNYGKLLCEVPGTSFLIGLNNLIYYDAIVGKNSLYQDNNYNENMLCFGLCTKKNSNETNWLIYTSRNNFLGRMYLFGNKNDVYLNLDHRKIVGNNLSYHIKDVEVFAVIIDDN